MLGRYKRTGDRDVDAVLSGIAELDERQSAELDSRLAQLHELVAAISDKYSESGAVLRALRAIRPVGERNELSAFERVAVCREYLARYPSAAGFRRALFFGSSDAVSDGARNKIAFIGNSYTDEAYSRFASRLRDPVAMRLLSFDELCENVYGGSCEFGILPIENNENGKLPHFYSMIDKYELKIAAVCSVDTSDNGSTNFALVRKNIEYPYDRLGRPNMLELFVTQVANEKFSEILTAAEFCSLELYRIDSLPLSHRIGKFITCPVFRVDDSDIDTFLLYMSVDFPQYTPIGVFTNINN